MKSLRSRLSKAGIKRKFLNERVLPGWWDDDIAEESAGFQEAVGIVSSRLGFSMQMLLEDEAELQVAKPSGVRFKKTKEKSEDDVALTTQLARRVAMIVAKSFEGEPPAKPIPEPEAWRESLLAKSEKDWVCLRHIIEASWEFGIPVVHLSDLPRDAKKPDALATIINGRPVIVIMNQRKTPSWLAFILAHELGHIFHGHLKEGETIVDQKLSEQTGETEEAEADEFATTLLTGRNDVGPFTSRIVKTPILAKLARQFGSRYRIAPGVAVLQWAFMTDHWGVAMKALQSLEKSDNAPSEFRSAMKRHLDEDSLSEDQWEWLSGLCM